MMISCHWQERRKLKFSELLMDTHHETSCHLICHPVMTWVMNRGATYAPLVMYTLNWDKRDTIFWNAATAWRHRRCPLRRQQDGHAVPTHNVQKTERRGVNAARLIECKLYKVLSIYQGFFFNHCLRQTVGWRCCTPTTVGSQAKCFCSCVNTDSRQWLVMTPETGFKVVRAQQPPLTNKTLTPHLSSLEHPPTYWLLLAVKR